MAKVLHRVAIVCLRVLLGAALVCVVKVIANIATPVPRTNLDLAYGFLAFVGLQFGPLVGAASGILGHLGSDLFIYHHVWSTWAVASGLYGLVFGLWGRRIRFAQLQQLDRRFYLHFTIVQAVVNVLLWSVLTPGMDVYLNGDNFRNALRGGLITTAANIGTTMLISALITHEYVRLRHWLGQHRPK